MPALFVYRGDLTEGAQALILETEGPAMTEGREIDRYRDIFCIVDRNHRYTAAEILGQDGEWREFTRTDFTRRG